MTTTTSPAVARYKDRAQTTLLLTLTALVRVLAIVLILARFPRGWFFTHGLEMSLLAENLLKGLGLSSPFGPPTGPTAFIAPGYPIFVAAIFKLFGVRSVASAAVIMMLHAAANTLTVALMMSIARRYFKPTAAVIVALLWILSPPLIMLPTIFWDTSFSVLAITAIVYFALRFQDSATPAVWLVLGVGCALTGLMNPALIPAFAVVLAWLAWMNRRCSLTQPLLAIITFAIVFSPWPIRNARVFHAFIPLRTTVGEELWMGNHDGATGFLMESVFPTYNATELNDYKQQGELAYTQHKSELAKEYIAAHPAVFLRMTIRRILRFWTGTGTEHGSPLFALQSTLTSALGLLGLWLLFRGRRKLAALIALPLLVFPIPYYITHAEYRYRIVIEPLMTLLAAAALSRFIRTEDPQPESRQA